ncbi:hypothetical protein P171DRAFT_366977 [Karstenula rhodostoma CBS 690.94]|uniref:Uncharacterized protein n=1 Tax=Karstenula rhodostoma CBS 690.94 TaxID=1392251 RepID=A0A9P4U8T3_9PLEO|nr:hypothetical protein P171DRAFT_366977 [Karstenula rhodostoma CBS 690.94]
MQPLLVHFCNLCSTSTTIPFSASVFSQNNSCSHCGAISTGININTRGKQQDPNMQQDELAQLFSAHMRLSQNSHHASQIPQAVPQEQLAQQQEQVSQPIIYASQHYTHSHHVAPSRQVDQEPAKTHIEPSELHAVFLRNSIDPSLLFPSQIDLFQNADNDQRLRLLELWRISPPSGSTARQLYDWPPTSLAQEETMAKLRYEKMLDQSMNQSIDTAAVQAARDIRVGSPDNAAEPYIVSGYDMLARREYEESAKPAGNQLRESTSYNQATDPVYMHAGQTSLWEKNVGSILDMENQYGAFAHARDFDVHRTYGDDEMVM